MSRTILVILLGLGLAVGPAFAEEAAQKPADGNTTTTTTTTKKKATDKPTDIVADNMEVLDAEHRAIFTGKVDMKRTDVHWTADKMIIDYNETKNADGTSATDVTFVDSTGNVTIVTNKQTITGQWAKMDVKENKLKVGGNVKVVQGETIMYGELLDSDLDTNQSVMSGGRVKGQFLPK